MTSQLFALCLDADDPQRLARFWAGLLGWETADGTTLLPDADTGFRLRFAQSDGPKDHPNQMHFDLTSATPQAQEQTVAKALALGAKHIDIGQRPEEGHVVLADPDGNEFCVIAAGNNFLAGCPFIGAVSSDGSREAGYFWSRALDWPLVWDQDEETAIQAPHGGPKISWGGPPFAVKKGKNRLHFDLIGDDREVGRLLSLGATRLQDQPGRTVLADPDGNEFCVLKAAAHSPGR